MRGAKVAMVIGGALMVLVGIGLGLGGGILLWAHATQRDDAGFYTTSTERLETPTRALVSEVDLGARPVDRGDWLWDGRLGTVRLDVAPVGDTAVFAGIAPRDDVRAWLAGSSYEEITEVEFGPFRTKSTVVRGEQRPGDPAGERFWTAQASGTDRQTLLWEAESGDWAVVVMNAAGDPGVRVDVSVGAKTGVLLPVGGAIGGVGVLLLAGGVILLVLGLRPDAPDRSAGVGTARPGARGAGVAAGDVGARLPTAYPVRVDAAMDPDVGRWTWLVKWVLVIPHVIVLAFLWIAAVVATVIAGFAILFTGRYPAAMFDFNVGVLRWTWRVGFYTVSAFGTDRYPPFSLQADPTYPAQLHVDRPGELSRGLVLVKWWLLAIPHYLIVAVFAGGWSLGVGERWGFPGGLIGLLALVAVLMLAFTGRYPQSMFDLVVGLNRWCYRVAAYVMLMTDEYPPFRLDQGGDDPVSVPRSEPPPTAGSGEDAASDTDSGLVTVGG